MAPALLPEGVGRGPSILLFAGPVSPNPDLATSSDRDEAILGVVEAALAAGARIAIPADPALALLAASASLAYAQPPTAEPTSEPGVSGLAVYETGRADEVLRRMLVPFAHRNALRYHDNSGQLVDLDRYELLHEQEPLDTFRLPPVTAQFLSHVEPLGAVVVAPSARVSEQVDLIVGRIRRHAVLVSSADPEIAARYRERDPFARFHVAGQQEPLAVMPWPSLTQELIGGWLEAARQ